MDMIYNDIISNTHVCLKEKNNIHLITNFFLSQYIQWLEKNMIILTKDSNIMIWIELKNNKPIQI